MAKDPFRWFGPLGPREPYPVLRGAILGLIIGIILFAIIGIQYN